MPQDVIGIDIAKGWVDTFHLSTARHERIAATKRALARFARETKGALERKPTPPEDPDLARLPALVARRSVLVGQIRAEKNRAGTTRDRWLTKEIAMLIKAVETRIATLVETGNTLAARSARLFSVPGIGPAISAALVARLPELGQPDRRRITSLTGLAPHATDSGLSRGRRHIWGGRADLRRALYIAAFIASHRDPAMKAFRARLQAAAKPLKLTLTASARKLLTILNARMRDGQDHVKQAA